MNYRVVKSCTFVDNASRYWLLHGSFVLLVSVFGIPLIPFWLLFGSFLTRRYLDSHHCVLTERFLIVKKGLMVKTEKTIPLDKITDMGLVEGPVMRALGLYRLTIETAGQSGVGSLVSLLGVDGAPEFRQEVLAQRDSLAGDTRATDGQVQDDKATLSKILASVRAIERHLTGDSGGQQGPP